MRYATSTQSQRRRQSAATESEVTLMKGAPWRGRVSVGIAVLAITALMSSCTKNTDNNDPYIWLESFDSPEAMEWVRAENTKTLDVLEKDPRFDGFYQTALRLAQSEDRIPGVTFMPGKLINFWQDASHIRGVLRATTLASYSTSSPVWTTILDLDELAKTENANWVWKGMDCLDPDRQRCLLMLSDGGEDAVTVREFDLASGKFVEGGFVLPTGKQTVAWENRDSLLVAREWTSGEMTESGYPFVVKRLVRGQSLDDATEIYRGTKADVLVVPGELYGNNGERLNIISRAVDFFNSDMLLVQGDGVVKLSVPQKSTPVAFMDGQIILRLSEAWESANGDIKTGSLAAFDARDAAAHPDSIVPVVIAEPGPREAIGGASATKTKLLVSVTDNVRGRIYVYSHGSDGGWSRTKLDLPDNVTTSVSAVDGANDQALIGVTGYLTPSSLWLANTAAASVTEIKTLKPQFDASNAVVEQLEAKSSDGTMIPYFIVHPAGMQYDGTNPTIINAYGGFEISLTPSYNTTAGKLWIERGGVWVVANIRGGGEFGPEWHEAGLKTRRQIIYDDFAAVAEDLIARKVTSPRHLGITGGSNGGLLMGVEMNQHPELWNAVQIAVPLLDMLRYEQIAAGASWVGEYGSVSNPDERAFLARISPYNNLKKGVKYPVPFIWTTTKDDRVGPQHARKFAARMSEYGLPYYFYEVIEGGHGAGANAMQSAHTTALGYTYFTRQLMDNESSN